MSHTKSVESNYHEMFLKLKKIKGEMQVISILALNIVDPLDR